MTVYYLDPFPRKNVGAAKMRDTATNQKDQNNHKKYDKGHHATHVGHAQSRQQFVEEPTIVQWLHFSIVASTSSERLVVLPKVVEKLKLAIGYRLRFF
jgi:hypothetical protein